MARPFFGIQHNDLETHALAEFAKESLGDFFPSLAQMREMTATPDTSTSVRERLAAINNRHADNLKRLYEWEAERFRNDAVDHYISYDETIPFTKAEDTVLNYTRPAPITGHAYETMRYSHLQTILPLQKKLAFLKTSEAAEQRRVEAIFPSSSADYRSIRDKQAQIRIARFLMIEDEHKGNADKVKSERDRVMSKFGWAWLQVTPLCQEYAQNEAFRSEVQADVRQVETSSDPRRKRL